MRKAHLQVTGPEGASGIQTADLKVEVQELGSGAGKRKILGIEDEGRVKTPTRQIPAYGAPCVEDLE
jgi:hypothetical protein